MLSHVYSVDGPMYCVYRKADRKNHEWVLSDALDYSDIERIHYCKAPYFKPIQSSYWYNEMGGYIGMYYDSKSGHCGDLYMNFIAPLRTFIWI